ncbi:MAG: adenine deaminase [Actinomycetota bacterium]|nr:adenine deaminase [Actinomycetota bacterium]
MREPDLAHRLAVARKDVPADAVLKGGRVLSVFTRELLDADVAIAGEHVAGIGSYEGQRAHDVTGLVLVPGFIDGHMHIESTKLTPGEFARAVLPHGTTTVVADPHEIGNVLGVEGIRMLLRMAEATPLDVYAMASSCVPASPLETGGHRLGPKDIAELIATEPRVLGLAELMNFPAVVAGDPETLAKIQAAGDRHVDGHAPGLTGPELNAYLAAGVRSDHECTTYQEALEKRRLGTWVMIREGSAARNLEALLPMVLEFGPENCMLVTDDREPHDLLAEGHLNNALRKAVSLGCPPEQAVVMATLHPARYHRLHEHGAVAPGYVADVVALPDLESFRPAAVWKRGALAFDGEAVSGFDDVPVPEWMLHTMHLRTVEPADFRIPATGRPIRVIEMKEGSLVTGASIEPPRMHEGLAVADPERDLAKIAVVERHRGSGRTGIGFVRGFGITEGALGSTVAHDAHNVMLVGTSDEDMAIAAERLRECGGGQVVVQDGRVLADLPLPMAGLVSLEPRGVVAERSLALERAAATCGVRLRAPFMALSFLALSVIPELKVTDLGLVDGVEFALVPLEA